MKLFVVKTADFKTERREHPEAEACIAELDQVLKRHGFRLLDSVLVREKPGEGGADDLEFATIQEFS